MVTKHINVTTTSILNHKHYFKVYFNDVNPIRKYYSQKKTTYVSDERDDKLSSNKCTTAITLSSLCAYNKHNYRNETPIVILNMK